MQSKRVLITGLPGGGKTSILCGVGQQGLTCWPEVSRAIMLEQQQRRKPVLPWNDLPEFAKLCQQRMLQQFKRAELGVNLYDRGLGDIIAFMALGGLEPGEKLLGLCAQHRYDQVFFTPPWQDIYQSDDIRPYPFEEAVAIGEQILHTYRQLGYQPIEIPCLPAAERCRWLLKQI